MEALFRFLDNYEVLVYLVLTLGALFTATRLWSAWQEWRQAVFGLEKELAFQKVRSSGAVFILLIMIGLSQFCLVSFILPFLPAATFRPTATPDLLRTPQATLSAADMTALSGTPVAPAGSIDCTPGQIIISDPAPGSLVQGIVVIKGTVNVPNFGFYKYEYAAPGSDTWATIAAGDKPVINGDLGAWNTSQLVPGDYQLRLLVTDNLGEALPACILPVRVTAP